MTETISILGGGVIGTATGIWLELAGHDTRLYAHQLPYETPPSARAHAVASNYAAASVIPHGKPCPRFDDVMATSQDAFDVLWRAASMGVRRQWHVKADETGIDHRVRHEEHVDWVERLNDGRLADADIPRRPGIDTDKVGGWVFPAYFVEMAAYVPRLYQLYEAAGGDIERTDGRLTRDEFLNLPGDLLVNCAGYGARKLVDDPADFHAARGHLVHVYADEFPLDGRGRTVSYNYHPDPSDVADGLEGSVYSYPRTDAIVLGGSRIRGTPAPDGEWDGGEIEGRTIDVGGIDVPARVVETNRRVLRETYDIDIDRWEWEAFEGWRPVRAPDGEGARIELDEIEGRRVVHNYGHGGAGVTLSWGSAAVAAEKAREVVGGGADRSVDTDREMAVLRHLQRIVREW